MLQKILIAMSLATAANLAQAGKLPMLEQASAVLKRAAWRASSAANTKQKQLSRTLATVGVAALVLTTPVEVSSQTLYSVPGEARPDIVGKIDGRESRHYVADGHYVVHVHDGDPYRSRLGGELAFYFMGWGGMVSAASNYDRFRQARMVLGLGAGLRPFANSSIEIKGFNFGSGGATLFSDKFVVALTHQLFGMYDRGFASPFNYAPFSVHIGPSYNYLGRHKMGVAWQIDKDLNTISNNFSFGLSYFGSFAGVDDQVHLLCLNFCLAFLD